VSHNSLAYNTFLLLRHFKRVNRRQKRRISVKRLYKGKRLPLRDKKYKQKDKSELYNINYTKDPLKGIE
jgi:hypothetical protein